MRINVRLAERSRQVTHIRCGICFGRGPFFGLRRAVDTVPTIAQFPWRPYSLGAALDSEASA